MDVKLINTEQVASMLSTSPKVAINLMESQGLHPISLGRGKGRGRRWLLSAVEEMIQRMHAAAQGPVKRQAAKPALSVPSLSSMSTDDLYALTQRHALQ